jgi:hypothetical protein
VNGSRHASLSTHLPIAGSLAPFYISSLVVALLLAAVSVAGLVYPSRVYPTQELLQAALANDVINLVLGVPILVGSMWLTWRGRWVGLLFWPGALLFVAYNSLARCYDLPLGWAFLANLALVALSVYALIALVARMDGESVRRRLAGRVRVRLSAAILVAFGVFALVRGVGVVGGALVGGTALPATELSVVFADVLISPAWVIGGVLLWRRKPLGYLSGAGLLFQASMLFVGVIGFVLLQPIVTDAPFDLGAAIVLSAMALPCLVPFGLYVRGIVKSEA